jgi:hypothetical protein
LLSSKILKSIYMLCFSQERKNSIKSHSLGLA